MTIMKTNPEINIVSHKASKRDFVSRFNSLDEIISIYGRFYSEDELKQQISKWTEQAIIIDRETTQSLYAEVIIVRDK